MDPKDVLHSARRTLAAAANALDTASREPAVPATAATHLQLRSRALWREAQALPATIDSHDEAEQLEALLRVLSADAHALTGEEFIPASIHPLLHDVADGLASPLWAAPARAAITAAAA